MIFEPDETDRLRRAETSDIRNRLARQISMFVGDEDERMTSLPGLSFAKVRKPMPRSSYLYEPSISMIVRGSKRVQLGGTTYLYDESRFLLTSVDLPTVTEVLEATEASPYLSLLMRLNLPVAREMIAEMGGPEAPLPGGTTGMSTGPATVDLFDAIERLVRLLDHPQDLEHIGALIQREIIYRILTSPAGVRFRQTVMLGTRSQRTAKAISWLRDNYAQSMSIANLAEHAGMGISTLHHHFREITSMSPLQYQKHLRLHEARRILRSENVDAAIAALRVGYESPTQFNREYRRMFGASPIQDVTSFRMSQSGLD
ncbi:L-rhamnose operon regulatory protein rhaS [Serratia rubidaea]|nr:L-rhamnose operon regulatory protein rhaS [Serratia rubidaea]